MRNIIMALILGLLASCSTTHKTTNKSSATVHKTTDSSNTRETVNAADFFNNDQSTTTIVEKGVTDVITKPDSLSVEADSLPTETVQGNITVKTKKVNGRFIVKVTKATEVVKMPTEKITVIKNDIHTGNKTIAISNETTKKIATVDSTGTQKISDKVKRGVIPIVAITIIGLIIFILVLILYRLYKKYKPAIL